MVEITFDNVHYFRDTPNVPSDLETAGCQAVINAAGVLARHV